MLAVGIWWLIVLLQTGAALGYRELSTHSAQLGSNTTIPCKFDVAAMSPAERPFTILWHFQEKEIFRSSLKSPDPRLSIDQAGILDGIADLSMSGVTIGDGGLYACSMVHTSGRKVKEIRLDIYAPPQTTITNKAVSINKKSVLSCLISGFYPVDIDIKWLRNGDLLEHVTVERPQRNPDGTYDIRSSVTIMPTKEDQKRIFSYKIQHESLNAPLQEDFQLIFAVQSTEDTEGSKQSFLLLLLLLLLVPVVITTIVLCQKKGRKKVAENEADQNESLVSSRPSGALRRQQDFISNKSGILPSHQQSKPQTHQNYEWLIRPGAPAIRTSSQTLQHISEDVLQSQTSVCNKTQLLPSNQQPEPQEHPKILKTSETPIESSGAVWRQDYPLLNLSGAIRTSSQIPQHTSVRKEDADNEADQERPISNKTSEDEPQSQTSVCNKTELLPSNQQQEPQEEPSETPIESSGAVRPQDYPFIDCDKITVIHISLQTPQDSSEDELQSQTSVCNKTELLPSNQQQEPQEDPKILKTSEIPIESSGAVRQQQDFISNKSEILPSHQQYEPLTHQKYALMNVPAVTPIRPSSQTPQHISGNQNLVKEVKEHYGTRPEHQNTKLSASNVESSNMEASKMEASKMEDSKMEDNKMEDSEMKAQHSYEKGNVKNLKKAYEEKYLDYTYQNNKMPHK